MVNVTDKKMVQYLRYLLAGAVSVLTFLLYLPSLGNEFVEWDDRLYVFGNPHILSLNFSFLKWAFSTFHAYNWHPLTWISHDLDYAIWGLNPLGHHLTNSILHAANAFLVVLLVVKLMEAGELGFGGRSFIAATVTGLLFGLHPLHVESVAWVAERKDLLCALFFLLSVRTYLQYAESISNHSASSFSFRHKDYLIALGFFILALLSKPMAVSLPAVLLILDWCPLGRIQSLTSFKAALVEKGPFITLSLLSSIVTIQAQKAAMELMKVVPLSTRVLVAAKSLLAYVWKMIVPKNLIPYYPYPGDVSLFSAEYSLVIAGVLGITTVCVVFPGNRKFLLAGWSYYVITLLPVLGIVQDMHAYLVAEMSFTHLESRVQ